MIKRCVTKILALCLLFGITLSSNANERSEVVFPILFVHTRNGEDIDGGMSHIKLCMEKQSNPNAAVQISVEEGHASNHSELFKHTMRAASLTVSLQRNTLLNGYRFRFVLDEDLNFNWDGPSAGAVTTLAIMCALDNREFPEDFAMTGTIAIDGTVGSVGGVPYKIRGAHARGIRRICVPDSCRFNDGEDIKALAESLDMEIKFIENIQQAYAFLCRQSDYGEAPVPYESEIRNLPPRTEKAMFANVRREFLAIKPWIEANLSGEIGDFLNTLLTCENDALENGFLFTAFEYSCQLYAMQKAKKLASDNWDFLDNEQIEAEESADSLIEYIKKLQKIDYELFADWHKTNISEFQPEDSSIKASSAQFEAFFPASAAVIRETTSEEELQKMELEDLKKYLVSYQRALQAILKDHCYWQEYSEIKPKLQRSMPVQLNADPNNCIAFEQAMYDLNDGMMVEIKQYTKDVPMEMQAWAILSKSSHNLAVQIAEKMRSFDYHLMASSFLQIHAVAYLMANHPHTVPHRINPSVHNAALRAMDECRELELPYVASIQYLELSLRGDISEKKKLEYNLLALFYAKAMILNFNGAGIGIQLKNLLDKGNVAAALQLIEANPGKFNDKDAIYWQGMTYLYAGKSYRKQALRCMERACQMGHPGAAFQMGQYFDAQDLFEEAKSYYENAANGNNADACLALGKLYEEGKLSGGVLSAKRWYKEGAARGSAECSERLRNLEY